MSTWRPLPGGAGSGEPRRLRDLLDRYAGRIGAPAASALHTVFGEWERVVGSQVAAHARPVSLTRGVLVVAVDDPAWAAQLRFLAPEMLRRLSEVVGEGVALRVDVRVRPNKPG